MKPLQMDEGGNDIQQMKELLSKIENNTSAIRAFFRMAAVIVVGFAVMWLLLLLAYPTANLFYK